MGDCMNMVSRSYGGRRPHFQACETCSHTSRRLRRFKKNDRVVHSYAHHVHDTGTGDLLEIRIIERPEAAIIEECKAAGIYYALPYGWSPESCSSLPSTETLV